MQTVSYKKVHLLDHMGSDLSVVNAARVSFGKTSKKLNRKDKALIKYLAEHEHWSPFAHCFLSFRIAAPIFVARQLGKHQVGLAWNEISRRYVDFEPEIYKPEGWRKRAAENVKQGSSDELVEYQDRIQHMYYDAARHTMDSYLAMLDMGCCPEQARAILPQSMMTEWVWSGSLYAFARVFSLRLKPDAQRETQEVVREISHCCSEKFPVAWAALRDCS
jgi:thymidylate synthase (FAD)